MDFQPYIAGLKPADPGPLSRFLPPLEEGVISAWLSHLDLPLSLAARPIRILPSAGSGSRAQRLSCARDREQSRHTFSSGNVCESACPIRIHSRARGSGRGEKRGRTTRRSSTITYISPNAKNVMQKFRRRLFYGAKARIYPTRAFTNVNIAATLANAL